MQIFKPLSIAAALALGCAWGNAQAAQPVQPLAAPTVDIHAVYPAGVPVTAQKDYFLQRIPGTHQYRKVYIFSRLDKNHDGQLSRSEIPLSMIFLRTRFQQADWNDNMRLSPAEVLMYEEHTAPAYTPVYHAMVIVASR